MLPFRPVVGRVETPARAIEDAFKDFTARDDIAVVLINQYVRSCMSRVKGVRLRSEGAHARCALSSLLLSFAALSPLRAAADCGHGSSSCRLIH
jgi:hypothetical protein